MKRQIFLSIALLLSFLVKTHAQITLCEGQTISNCSGITGGTWTSANTTVATVTSTTITGVAAGTTNLSWTGSGCGPFVIGVTVNPNPVVTITGNTSVCAGLSTTLSGAPGGGTWSSSNTSAATGTYAGRVTGSTSIQDYGMTTAVNITYSVTNTYGCSASAIQTMTVYPKPKVGVITPTPPRVCKGETITISIVGGDGGGTWSSSNTATATVLDLDSTNATFTGTPNSIAHAWNTVNISYTATNPACFTKTTILATVKGDVYHTGSNIICERDYHGINMHPSGGTYDSIPGTCGTCAYFTYHTESPGGGMENFDAVDIYGLNAGTGVFKIAHTSAGTGLYCAGSDTITVNVAARPDILISGNNTLCYGETITLSGGTSGGNWTLSSTTVATNVGAVVTAGTTAGTAIVTLTYLGSYCVHEEIDTMEITVSDCSGGGSMAEHYPGNGSTLRENSLNPDGSASPGRNSEYTDDLPIVTRDQILPGMANDNIKPGVSAAATKDGQNSHTSLTNMRGSADFHVYPNPAHDKLTVEFDNIPDGRKEIRICDMSGKVVRRKIVNRNSQEIDVSDIAPGTYYIRTVIKGKTFVKKINIH